MNRQQKLAEYIQLICRLTESEATDFVDAFTEGKIKNDNLLFNPIL